jgi:hypothetical protein
MYLAKAHILIPHILLRPQNKSETKFFFSEACCWLLRDTTSNRIENRIEKYISSTGRSITWLDVHEYIEFSCSW